MRTLTQASINKPLVVALFAVLAVNTYLSRFVSVETTNLALTAERIRETNEGTILAEVKVDGVVKHVEMQVSRTARVDDTGKALVRYRIKPLAKDIKSAYNLSDDVYLSSEEKKKLENCDKCYFDAGFETNPVIVASKDLKELDNWLVSALEEAKTKGHLDKYVEGLKSRGRGTKGSDSDDAGINKEKSAARKNLEERIYNCEIPEDSKLEDSRETRTKLTSDEKIACYSKRIEELSNRHGEKGANGKKITDAEVAKFYKKLEGHLSKCLSDKEKREEMGCLEVAEDLKDRLIDHDSEGIHKMGHKVDGLIVRGQVKIESAEVLSKLSVISGSLRSAEALAQRTGNYSQVTMLQNQLQQLHQYHMQRQLPVPGNAAFYLNQLELDPEIGLGSMNYMNEMQVLNSRIEEQFMTAANPRYQQSRFGPNGPYGNNRMGMNGMMRPGMMGPGMMRPGMMGPGMMGPGMMGPGMMGPGMMGPGMMGPGMMGPGMMGPGMMGPGMMGPGMMGPGMMGPGMMGPRPMGPPGVPYQNGYQGGAFGPGMMNGGFGGGGYLRPYSPYNPIPTAGNWMIAPGGGLFGNGNGGFGGGFGGGGYGGFGGGFGGGAYLGANMGGAGYRPIY